MDMQVADTDTTEEKVGTERRLERCAVMVPVNSLPCHPSD